MRQRQWYDEASWIWVREYDDTSPEAKIVLFRRHFDLQDLPKSPCMLRVSADTRYRLYVNGTSVSIGPCKSYPERWYFETVDIQSFLRAGRNVLSAKVLRFSDKYPGSLSLMRTAHPGLIVHFEVQGQALHTSTDWQARLDTSTLMASRKDWNYALGPPFLVLNENVDATKLELDWHSNTSDAWSAAEVVNTRSMMLPVLDSWKLHERPIPVLTETEGKFSRAVCCSDPGSLEDWSKLATEGKPFEIPPNSEVWIELEASEYTTAYLSLKCHASAGTKIQLLCAEGYEAPMARAGPGVQRRKHDRTDHVNGKLYGPLDIYTTRAGQNCYEPFWFRAFRFIRLEISTLDGPVVLQNFSFRTTYYPLDIQTSIGTSSSLDALWTTSAATLRNCMHETYEDCPFYEQNQFLIDARLQMLLTYVLARDDRLARKTMREFHASRRENGLLAAQFPGPGRCVNIPMFSLFFVAMVHDHMRYFADRELVRGYLATVDGVLEYFQGLVGARGLVGQFDVDDWAFVDWVDEWQGKGGLHSMAVPPAYWQGAATMHSLVYAWALQLAAGLCSFVGRNDTAAEYHCRADAVVVAVNQTCFDGSFYTDGPSSTAYSQHSQVFAVLTGAVKGPAARALLKRTVAASMPKCSYAMTFYTFRAAAQTGLYEELWPQLIRPWEEMLAQNLVTFAEDDISMRSDCHGWSATPIYEIAVEIFGVRPGRTPTSTIAPRVNLLPKKAQGEFVVSKGKINLDIREGVLNLVADSDMEVTLGEEGKMVRLKKGSEIVWPACAKWNATAVGTSG